MEAADDKLKGVTLTATLDGKLEVVKLEGYDKVIDALAGGNDNDKATVKATLPEAALKQVFSEIFATVPGGQAKLGGTWKRSTNIPVAPLGDVSVTSNLKLDSVKDSTASITWTGTGTFKGTDEFLVYPSSSTRSTSRLRSSPARTRST